MEKLSINSKQLKNEGFSTSKNAETDVIRNNEVEKPIHYKIINNLYTSQEDFIVIGLCGKTGSGSSTVSKICQQDFERLFLSTPGSIHNNLYNEHEYRILYNFAKVNWRHFYRIKVSALITATVLQKSEEELLNFLVGLCEKIASNKNETLNIIREKFFKLKMYFNFAEWFKLDPGDNELIGEYLNNLPDKDFQEKFTINIDSDINEYHDKECMISEAKTFELDGTGDKIEYYQDGTCIWIENKDLYKMFMVYKDKRLNKTTFKNPLYFWILRRYIYDFLPIVVHEFWDEIKKYSKSLPILAMQMLEINLRICKKPYLIGDVHFEENGYVYIAEDINIAIKLLSSYNTIWCNKLISFQAKKIESNDSKNKHNKHTLVVIDSIKNPFESLFLKQRYSNYYLLGIYTEDDERKKRLEHKGLNRDQVKEIDTIETLSYFKKICKEYVDSEKKSEFSENNGYIATKIVTQIVELKLNNVLPFILQNVSSCLDSADIFINNIKDNASRLKIKYELIKYVSLAMHPGLILPTHLERCMQIAYTAKLNSGCISRQVGAVITDKDYHLLSIGWNQQPEDQIPCSYRNLKELINHWSVETYSDYENDDNEELMNRIKKNVEEVYTSENNLYKNGKLPYYCFKNLYNKITNKQNQVHPRSLHAEETAFLNLGPTGKILVKGGCLFTTSSPCELCSKKAKYMEISKIYYIEPYSGISYKHVLCAGSNESRPEFILFTGAIGRAYMQLYTPLLPLKDEHELWLGDKTENIVVK